MWWQGLGAWCLEGREALRGSQTLAVGGLQGQFFGRSRGRVDILSLVKCQVTYFKELGRYSFFLVAADAQSWDGSQHGRVPD